MRKNDKRNDGICILAFSIHNRFIKCKVTLCIEKLYTVFFCTNFYSNTEDRDKTSFINCGGNNILNQGGKQLKTISLKLIMNIHNIQASLYQSREQDEVLLYIRKKLVAKVEEYDTS